MPERMITCNSKCPRCSNVESFQIPESVMRAKRSGKSWKAAADGKISDERIRQLEEHLCPNCQAAGR